jgi:hypothetical protein
VTELGVPVGRLVGVWAAALRPPRLGRCDDRDQREVLAGRAVTISVIAILLVVGLIYLAMIAGVFAVD